MSVEANVKIDAKEMFTFTSVSIYVQQTHLDPFLSFLKRWFRGSVCRFTLIQLGI